MADPYRPAHSVYPPPPHNPNDIYPPRGHDAYPTPAHDVYPPRANDVYPPRANDVYPPRAHDVYPPPAKPVDIYPPPAKANNFYPPPAKSYDDYPPPAKSHDDYPPPAKSHDDYPPPATSSKPNESYPPPAVGTPAYHPPATNTNANAHAHAHAHEDEDDFADNNVAPPPPPPPPQQEVGYNRPPPPPPQQQQEAGYNRPSTTIIEKHQSFHYESNPDNTSTTGSGCFKTICIIILILLILALVFILIAWIVFRPRLPEIEVTNLSLSNFRSVGNSMSGTWDINFSVKNPNSKMTLDYEKTTVALLLKTDTLLDTTINPFKQDKKAETPLKVSLTANSKYMDSKILDDIKSERERVGNVEFDVKLLAPVSFDARIYKTKKKSVKVHCKDLVVSLSKNSQNGSMSKGSKKCRVSF